MSNLELLKKELITQKEVIEDLGGSVLVSNTNPSPSEITEGIKTLKTPDLSGTTATAADVILGKTFYSGDLNEKTGTFDLDKYTYELFLAPTQQANSTEKVYFTNKDGVKTTREYAFKSNYNPIVFTFNSDIEEIAAYTFHDCPNFEFPNFSSLESLIKIGDYAFTFSRCLSQYLASLPPNLQHIGQRAFGDATLEGATIIIPESVTHISSYAFARTSERVHLKEIKLPTVLPEALSSYMLSILSFDCDIRLPETVTEIGAAFNYRGSFNNITVPASYKIFRDNCFGGLASDPVSNYHLETITFEGTTIPTTVGRNIFATQHKTNGFKIYVQDEILEEFKAITNLASYKDYIYPISQKE